MFNKLSYTSSGEIILTRAQAQLLKRLLQVLDADQVEMLIAALEEVETMEQGKVTLKIYQGHPRFIERTFCEDLRK